MEEWVVLHVTKRWARTKFVASWFTRTLSEVGDHFHQNFHQNFHLG